MAVDLGTAYGKIVIDSSGARRGFSQASSAGLGLKKTLAGLGVGLAVGKVFTSTLRTAQDFNQAIADLNSVADVTPEVLARLEQQALKSGAATRFSASEAAAAQLELAKAGLTASQILNGGLDTALALAAAGNIEVADAATIAANAVQQFALSGDELSGVADAFAIAANRTTADVGDFGIALSQGGAAAKQAGLSFKDTTTFLEALALQGTKGSDAGTSLKTALLALAGPVGAGKKAIKEYGLEFFQANGEIKSAAGIAGELQSKLGGLNRQQRVAVLQAIAGRDGFRALAAVMDLGAQGTARLRKELDQEGKAAEVAAKRQDSLAGDVEQLGGSIETLQITATKKAIPALRSLARSATDAINDIASGEGKIGAIAADVAAVATGVASVVGNVVRVAFQVAQIGVGLAAPFVGLAGAILGSESGTRLLTAAVIGLAGAYVAAKVAAAALFVIQKAQAIYATATAFLQLATSVRSASQAMALFQAATLTTPLGLVVAGIGAAVGAVALLTGGFRSGPSAAETMAGALDRVKEAADAAAGALDRARAAADKITDTKLAAASAALAVEQAERTYADAVDRSGKGSLEARTALNQLQQARQRVVATTREANQTVRDAGKVQAEELQTAIKRKQAADEAIRTYENYLAINRSINSATAEGRAQSAKYADKIAELKVESGQATKQISGIQGAARRAARSLANDASPAAQKTRDELLALANAKPAELPQVVASISKGTRRALGISKANVKDIVKVLTGTDTSVDLSSFEASIRRGMNNALAAANDIAAQIRAAMSRANADTRQSPSANDLLRASLVRSESITTSGMKRTLSATRRGVDSILAERARLEARLEALDRAQAARDAAEQGTTGRNRLEQRRQRLDRADSLLSNVESSAGDLVSKVGQALDERVRQYDARLTEITTRRNILAGGQAIQDADKALAQAQARLARIQAIISEAAGGGQQAAAEAYLEKATRDVEDAQLAAEAARISVERDKASLTAERKKESIAKDIGDLVERLRSGQITATRFNQQIKKILGDKEVRAALQASGVSLGLAFSRGLQRTRAEVRSSAKGLAQIVASYLRLRSPAEVGPLAFDFRRSGAAVGKDFAAGLEAQRRTMQYQAQAFAQAAVPRVATNTAQQGSTAAAPGLTQHNTFNVKGPFDARQASFDLAWNARYAASGVLL